MMICCVLLGFLIGFLFYNFYFVKIFLGDSGVLMIGFIIGFFFLFGFKNIIIIVLFFLIVILVVLFIDILFVMI